MLEASDTPALDALAGSAPAGDSVQVLRELIERMHAEIKFSQTKIEALNFEIARLKPRLSLALDTYDNALTHEAADLWLVKYPGYCSGPLKS